MLRLFSEIMEEYNTSMLRYRKSAVYFATAKNISTYLRRISSYIRSNVSIPFFAVSVRKHITSEELDKLLDSQQNNLFVDNVSIQFCRIVG